ncbi:MAG TPA: hypothetical protein VLW85_18285, partial [Myxococcales bacterium]|nr:hypothetical protein [Myxococcales bacterium]
MRLWRLLSLSLLVACGGNSPPASAPLPTVVDMGGPKLTHPQLVSITYSDDGDAAALADFARWIVGSQWLAQVGADYGIGAGTVLATVALTTAAPDTTSDIAIVTSLYDGIDSGTLPTPAGGDFSDTLYMVHFPAHTTIKDPGQQSCTDYLAYHANARRNGREISYAVVATCPGGLANVGTLESREVAASHEFIEAATDAIPANNPGWLVSDPTSAWQTLGGEVADLCERGDDSHDWVESGFTVQRIWSQSRAGKGEPCIPIPSPAPVFFTLDASPPGLRRVAVGGTTRYQLAVHGSAVDLEAFSDTQGVSVKLGAAQLHDGDSTTVDVTLPASL